MKGIKHLPRPLCSYLRSSVILFDLTRVVEELVFNSVDAGASKICVSVGVGACYIKVEDDGCGVSRDGLVLFGEKYATSKVRCVAEMDAGIDSFGYRGEALGSISDVSLLEVITKARGRPTAYHKIIKGGKCLFLGITDNRQDVGTTVIVRDLFYNQPVRRRCMQSSPKKVLHSVKKCVFRVALVYPQISFKVVDVGSEDELLATYPSLSPLPLVSSGFGNDVSSSLCEVNFSERALRLSGYMSGPVNTFSTKAFQYIYINSRFICKGPIHKLLNDLTSNSKSSLSIRRCEPEFHIGKRGRTQEYPAYMLNLHCPQSSYDLNFEPSKTVVEFKDWPPILSFIEKAVRHTWRQIPAHLLQGESLPPEDFVHDKKGKWKEGDKPLPDLFAADPGPSEVSKEKSKIWNYPDSVSLGPSTSFLDIPPADIDWISCQKSPGKSSREPITSAAGFRGCRDKTKRETDFSYHCMTSDAWDVSDAKCNLMATAKNSIHLGTPEIDLFPVEDNFLSDEPVLKHRTDNCMKNDVLDSGLDNFLLGVNSSLSRGPTESISTYDWHGFKRDAGKVPVHSGCPRGFTRHDLGECLLYGENPSQFALSSDQKVSESQFGDFRTKKKWRALENPINIANTDYSNDNSQSFVKTSCHEPVSPLPSRILRKCQKSMESDGLLSDFTKPCSTDKICFSGECGLQNQSHIQVGKRALHHCSTSSEQLFASPFPLSGPATWEVEDLVKRCGTEGRSCRSYSSYLSHDEANDALLHCYTVQNSLSEGIYPTSGCSDGKSEHGNCFSPEINVHRVHHLDSMIFDKGEYCGKRNDEADWICLDSHTKSNGNYSRCCPNIRPPQYNDMGRILRHQVTSQICEQSRTPMIRSTRSSSAPPFYKVKNKFSCSYNLSVTAGRKPNDEFCQKARTLQETGHDFMDSSQPYLEPILSKGSLPRSRTHMEKRTCGTHNTIDMEKHGGYHVSDELEDPEMSVSKWQNCGLQPTIEDISHDRNKLRTLHNHEDNADILDISSGLLHLVADSLVPESINKDCLESAKVLEQLDKKFIPVIAGTTLALIDQHAADERIRLEELRGKVLSAKGKTVAYLDPEQELVLPEIGFQLMQNYAEQIKNWGWIYNIHAHGSGSFTKNLKLLHRQQITVTLVAVPCILGINLSEKDLTEFLEQLAETDGSSTMPPSVLRILNSKACRGAIMFGDSLLPSECSLIVEELRKTSLCFQCAHGRPTTVPLVNLEALHRQLARLNSQNGGSTEQFHGLRHHQPSIERAKLRLSSASG